MTLQKYLQRLPQTSFSDLSFVYQYHGNFHYADYGSKGFFAFETLALLKQSTTGYSTVSQSNASKHETDEPHGI